MEVSTSKISITTGNCHFNIDLTEYISSYHFFHFSVYNNESTCIEGHITLEKLSSSERIESYENTTILHKINALQECSLHDILDPRITYPHGERELIDAVFLFIKSRFSTIKTIRLNDTSYIPCIRESSDTIDLLVYSIALYEKTWYEDKLNAYITPLDKYNTYRSQIDYYASNETKKSITWQLMYEKMIHGNRYTNKFIDDNRAEFEKIYIESNTFPQFLQEINHIIPIQFRCRFFKDWLENFIRQYIIIEREWYIDL
jgi:hypothetical protein